VSGFQRKWLAGRRKPAGAQATNGGIEPPFIKGLGRISQLRQHHYPESGQQD
jgi:hypothetical protein